MRGIPINTEYMAFKKDNKVRTSNFSSIRVSLASPEEILSDSHGEVLKPETINYRTYKPERDGLFCERIFGPVKDFECHCGKYKRIRYRNIVCDRCGVEVTEKKVRRERMGHIKLEVPVAHVWYFRSNPNKMGHLLGIPAKKLEAIVYYESYVVVQPGCLADEVTPHQVIGSEADTFPYFDRAEAINPGNDQLDDSDPTKFICRTGAEALYDLLCRLDLDALSYELRHKASTDTSQQRKNDALKRLQIVESFRQSKEHNRPEWMILKVLPVIPPDLRPLVPLDGGRFATSDLNDLYRRVIIRNARLRRMLEIKAPKVIVRNEKRMLQEAVDSLLDNSRKSSSVRSDSNRPLKSLSDSLKGKQGRFRQNLLGKRVDYSARSVIVVGPELKMHECGIPKHMAAELYKPFVISKLIERGIVKTVKSAKKIVDRKEPVVWDILEHVMKGHPVLLNRAPTLHRLGIQAFQPKMIEGKAIQLHPLACTAFNADFDGDQMAVHLPLSPEAVLEAQTLMLASHNILNPANGAPITVPSQDMVLGLYYITKLRSGSKGEGSVFYGAEEATIAYNEGKLAMHAPIKVLVDDVIDGKPVRHLVETSVGRLIVNEFVPRQVGYINEVLSKRALRGIIGRVIQVCGVATTAKFLDDIKDLGFYMAFKGGLSFNLGDVIIPEAKERIIKETYETKVQPIIDNYNMGSITDNERYNQVIDAWTTATNQIVSILMDEISKDNQGFNSIYMMMDSGARGSKEQIRQLSGLRGLMAKPQKSGTESSHQTIENPILSNFKEGLSVLEYFISTHGARKGLADTALKTADAGYLTRRLVDVSQDVIITEEDCGTLRGLVATALKNKDLVVSSLYDRILGRVSVHDVIHPLTGEVLVRAGEEIREEAAQLIEESPIEQVEIRSVLTCESTKGVCAKCYGRNLATNYMVQEGEVVGVIAAQSIGEPGTQLTLRTFHVGGVASNRMEANSVVAKFDGVITFEELRTVEVAATDKLPGHHVVVSRTTELRILDPRTRIALATVDVPYAAALFFKEGDLVEKGQTLFTFDPFNSLIVSEFSGRVAFENLIEGTTYRVEADEKTGIRERIIIESKDRNKAPRVHILDAEGNVLKSYNLPVNAHLQGEDVVQAVQGTILAKIPRATGSTGDITGGLPRVTELFEARSPHNVAVVAEIDGDVSFGKQKRGNYEVIITPRIGEPRKYLVPLSKQLLVQDGDFVRSGMPLSDGAIAPADILEIKGPTAVQEHIVNGVQEVYRAQDVKINDKHFEVIVRQMMRKVEIVNAGDTMFLEQEVVDKLAVQEANNALWGKKVVVDAGDSQVLHPGQIVTLRNLRNENSQLKRRDLRLVEVRDAEPAVAKQVLQGITRAALQTNSFMSAASFQETTKVLNDAAVKAKVDDLLGLKENVICGHLIPAGTGLRKYKRLVVMPKSEMATQEELEPELEEVAAE